jgi:hypothetical protein
MAKGATDCHKENTQPVRSEPQESHAAPWRLQTVANRPEESGPLRGPRQIAARAMYKIPPRTSSAPSPIRNILGLSIYRCHAGALSVVFSGSTGSNWRSSMRREPSGRRRNRPPTCPKLLPRPSQLTLGARVRRSSRSVWSGFRPDMSEGAWRSPRPRRVRVRRFPGANVSSSEPSKDGGPAQSVGRVLWEG